MRIALSTGWFFPESVGGTEVYVADLARELAAVGHEVEVGTAGTRLASGRFVHEGVSCFRWNVGGDVSSRTIRGLDMPPGLEEFREWLRGGKFDVYHQHSLTMGCWFHHLRVARELGLRCFLTVHLPDALCLRGTLMEAGENVCDGRVVASRCIDCAVGQPFATMAKLSPGAVSHHFWENDGGKIGSLLGKKAQVAGMVAGMREAVEVCERVVLVSEWLRDVFLLNGMREGKLCVCRQGVSQVFAGAVSGGKMLGGYTVENPLRVGYVGRFAHIKGVDILIQAVRRLPESCAVRLVLAGPEPRDVADASYLGRLRKMAVGDGRIIFREAVPREEMAGFYRSVDVLAVPSRCLETGPLVAMEALACGTPVVGMARGGLLECLPTELHGMALVGSEEPDVWAAKLCDFVEQPQILSELRLAVSALPVRTMRDVAKDMDVLYHFSHE